MSNPRIKCRRRLKPIVEIFVLWALVAGMFCGPFAGFRQRQKLSLRRARQHPGKDGFALFPRPIRRCFACVHFRAPLAIGWSRRFAPSRSVKEEAGAKRWLHDRFHRFILRAADSGRTTPGRSMRLTKEFNVRVAENGRKWRQEERFRHARQDRLEIPFRQGFAGLERGWF